MWQGDVIGGIRVFFQSVGAEISDDSDNFSGLVVLASFAFTCADPDLSPDGIFIMEKFLREAGTDDHHRVRVALVAFIEEAATYQRHSHGFKETGCDHMDRGARLVRFRNRMVNEIERDLVIIAT